MTRQCGSLAPTSSSTTSRRPRGPPGHPGSARTAVLCPDPRASGDRGRTQPADRRQPRRGDGRRLGRGEPGARGAAVHPRRGPVHRRLRLAPPGAGARPGRARKPPLARLRPGRPASTGCEPSSRSRCRSGRPVPGRSTSTATSPVRSPPRHSPRRSPSPTWRWACCVDGQDGAQHGETTPDLDDALAYRLEVYQAQGMVMVDLGVGIDEAMARLRGARVRRRPSPQRCRQGHRRR